MLYAGLTLFTASLLLLCLDFARLRSVEGAGPLATLLMFVGLALLAAKAATINRRGVRGHHPGND
jgi:uncharacterized membrane protein YgdD (TMEM256/DUF423 family)